MGHLRENGFEVETHDVSDEELTMLKAQNGVTPELSGCHTAFIDGIVVEGHVPAEDINRLLAEGHEGIKGISVPGMPSGSPGMGGTPERYESVTFAEDGTVKVFQKH